MEGFYSRLILEVVTYSHDHGMFPAMVLRYVSEKMRIAADLLEKLEGDFV